MRFQHILHALHFEPWLITEDWHSTILAIVESKLGGEALSAGGLNPLTGAPLPKMEIRDGIAQIPITGPIGKGLGNLEKSCGATSIDDVQANIAEALARPEVRGILLNVNSPGGSIAGIPETAAMIAGARERKPVVAFTDGVMASAAYWFASQADAIVASPSSIVGSIGVLIPWRDSSKAAEAQGVRVGVVKNKGAIFKGAGYPGTSYTEDQMADLQARADELGAMFKGAILSKRPNVKAETMRGQTMFGAQAVASDLVDEVGSSAAAWATVNALTKMRRGT